MKNLNNFVREKTECIIQAWCQGKTDFQQIHVIFWYFFLSVTQCDNETQTHLFCRCGIKYLKNISNVLMVIHFNIMELFSILEAVSVWCGAGRFMAGEPLTSSQSDFQTYKPYLSYPIFDWEQLTGYV